MDDVDGSAVLDALVHEQGDLRTVERRLERLGLTDGLPLGDVSPVSIAELTAATGLDPGSCLGALPPLRGELTPARLAACAALAGCDPDHMPVVVAIATALLTPELNALGVSSTTGSAAFAVVVNGPVRHRLGFNSGANCLGPGSRTNARVGRCVSLVCRILGGAREGVADMATMGQPGKYSFCFAENEEESPWGPLHEDRGCAPGSSAVTVMGVGGTIEAFDPAAADAPAMIGVLARALAGSSPVAHPRRELIGGGHQLVLISPEWAAVLGRDATHRVDIGRALFDESGRITGLRVAETAEDIVVVVAGGVGIKQTIVPGWSGGSTPVTVAVREGPDHG